MSRRTSGTGVPVPEAEVRVCLECELVTPLERCPECGGRTRSVGATPPAEVRPVGRPYLRFLWEVLESEGLPRGLLSRRELLLVNRAPELDLMDEVVGPEPILAVRYDLREGRWVVVLKEEGARRLYELGGACVEVDRGAAEAVREGRNLFAPGVVAADDVGPGDWVVVEHGGRPVAFGRAVMSGEEMVRRSRGLAVRTRGSVEGEPRRLGRDFRRVAGAHEEYLEGRLERSVEVVRERVDGPAFVSFSGGKDSLVTAVVGSEAGVGRAVFVDTGMELPETLEAVERASGLVDVEVLECGEGVFYRVSEALLPPSRDNRWCTLVGKLAPLIRYVRSEFGGRFYTLVGVRRYESEARAGRGRVWESEAVPGQVNVAPIFDWSSLEVWLFLYAWGLPYNELYEHGFDRVGCFMCPASKVGDFELVRRVHGRLWREWVEFLESYRRRHGLPEDWLRYHVWRWLRPEGEIRRVASEGALRWGERVLSRWLGRRPREAAREFRERGCPGCPYCSAVGDGECVVLRESLRRVSGRG